jgi:hypothetical protein
VAATSWNQPDDRQNPGNWETLEVELRMATRQVSS